MNMELVVISLFDGISCANVVLSPDDTFICEDSDNRQMFSEEEANKLKEEFNKR